MANDVVYCDSCMEHITTLCAPATVQFPYLETCGVLNWGKTKLNGGPGLHLIFCTTPDDCTLDVGLTGQKPVCVCMVVHCLVYLDVVISGSLSCAVVLWVYCCYLIYTYLVSAHCCLQFGSNVAHPRPVFVSWY